MKFSILFFVAIFVFSLPACQSGASGNAGKNGSVSGGMRNISNTPCAPEKELNQAMDRFIMAIVDTNDAQILSSFSRVRPWVKVNYEISTPKVCDRAVVHYSEMAKEWNRRGEWWNFFFEKTDGAMAYRYWFHRGEKWRYAGNHTFVCPMSDSGNVYIKWRKEGESWVVDEIGEGLV